MKKKIVIFGPILSRSGYGEMARFAYRSLKKLSDQYDLFVLSTNWGNTGGITEETEEKKEIEKVAISTQMYIQQMNNNPDFDISLQVTIPNEWKKIAKKNIGYTAGIETNFISPAWLQPSLEMDKIIVISEHAKKGFVETNFGNNEGQQFNVTTPIEVCHFPVKNLPKVDLGLDLKYDFNFLCVCQWGPRKNLEHLITNFIQEFKNEEVGLVLKINSVNDSVIDKEFTISRLQELLNQYTDKKCSITLLHGQMSEAQLNSLYTHPKIKAIVSSTHGEGFGFPLFEAAYNELPVIATDWSGHLDFLTIKDEDGAEKKLFAKVDYELKNVEQQHVWAGVLEQGTSWAYPKSNSLKSKIRDVYKDYGRFKSWAKKLNTYIRQNFTEEKITSRFAELVTDEKVLNIKVEDLPKISIIGSVYDADEHIEGYLENITSQTIFKEKCELILINANSPGNEEEIIKKYTDKYANIIYRRLDQDPGIYAVWNMGVKMSSGEFITNANMDDRKAPDSLEKHAKSLFSNKDVDLVYADSYIVHEPNKKWEDISASNQRYNFEQFSTKAMLRGNLPHNNPMWRKTLHDKYGYFNENYKSASDWEFWLNCVSNGVKFAKINNVLGIYYFNPKGISTNFENFSWKQKEEEEIYEKFSNIIK